LVFHFSRQERCAHYQGQSLTLLGLFKNTKTGIVQQGSPPNIRRQ
jgi:hypothetical protein